MMFSRQPLIQNVHVCDLSHYLHLEMGTVRTSFSYFDEVYSRVITEVESDKEIDLCIVFDEYYNALLTKTTLCCNCMWSSVLKL